MPRRRYRLTAIIAFFLLLVIYHVTYNSWDSSSNPYTDVRIAPDTPAVHPNLDTTAPPTEEPPNNGGVRSTLEMDLQEHNAAAERPLIDFGSLGHNSKHVLSQLEPLQATPESTSAVNSMTSSSSSSSHTSSMPSSSDNRIHWKSFTQVYPVPTQSIVPLPMGKPKVMSKIQFDFQPESAQAKQKRQARQEEIKASISRVWQSYRQNAFMHDELAPVSGHFRDPFCGWAATLVDSLDTLWIAGLKDEFDDAVENGVAKIDFTFSEKSTIPVFETTIRYLGGLLSAYDVSGGHQGKYKILLDKAVELAEILFGAFDTPNRMPVLYYEWAPQFASKPHQAGLVSIAELATLSMEFTRLAQLTGENRYYDAVDRITDALIRFQKDGHAAIPGLFPERLDASGCNSTAHQVGQGHGAGCVAMGLAPASRSFSMGGSQDSAYEYFVKQYLLLGGLEPKYEKLHQDTVTAIDKSLLYRPMLNSSDWDVYFTAKMNVQGNTEHHMEAEYEATHLTCFIGGMYGIGSKIFGREQDLDTAKRLTDGCVWAYQSTRTGIMPEAALMVPCPGLEKCKFDKAKWYESLDSSKVFRDQQVSEWELKYGNQAKSSTMDDSIPERPQSHEEFVDEYISKTRLPAGYSKMLYKNYSLRPEAIESVWYMYRITGDATWMDKGWTMFEATMAATKTSLANSAISNVMADEPYMDDKMESYWIAETLKYYYLLFSDPDVISLDEWVLNTEAHPFRRPV